MWWCCGKLNEKSAGCKISKHEEKNEDDVDDVNVDDDGIPVTNQKLKCHCCKEIGHLSNQCIRDPNLKTKENP